MEDERICCNVFICLVTSYVILFFCADFVLENLFGALAVFSLIMAGAVTWFTELSNRIETLEKKIEQLEKS